jgi:hypothetical protein
VYWADWKNPNLRYSINVLIAVRKTCGITSTSRLYVDLAEGGLYTAYIGSSGAPTEVAVKIGTRMWSPPDSTFKLAGSGDGWAVFTRAVVKVPMAFMPAPLTSAQLAAIASARSSYFSFCLCSMDGTQCTPFFSAFFESESCFQPEE